MTDRTPLEQLLYYLKNFRRSISVGVYEINRMPNYIIRIRPFGIGVDYHIEIYSLFIFISQRTSTPEQDNPEDTLSVKHQSIDYPHDPVDLLIALEDVIGEPLPAEIWKNAHESITHPRT